MTTTLDTERLADEGSGWIRLPREPGRAAERIRATYSAAERDELIALLLAMGSSGERRQASGERRLRGSDGERASRPGGRRTERPACLRAAAKQGAKHEAQGRYSKGGRTVRVTSVHVERRKSDGNYGNRLMALSAELAEEDDPGTVLSDLGALVQERIEREERREEERREAQRQADLAAYQTQIEEAPRRSRERAGVDAWGGGGERLACSGSDQQDEDEGEDEGEDDGEDRGLPF